MGNRITGNVNLEVDGIKIDKAESSSESYQSRVLDEMFKAVRIPEEILNKESSNADSIAHSVYCEGFAPLKRRKNDE